MSPLFRRGPRGKAFVRVPDAFVCSRHSRLARGRESARFLD